jgi:hypothetical protein
LTKIRLTGFDTITPKVKLGITRAISEAKFEKTFRDAWVDKLRKEGLDAFLNPGTIATRKRLALFNTTHPEYQPEKPNLTFTGQLLDSLKGFFQGSRLIFTIRASGKHRPYETASTTSQALAAALEKRNKQGNVKQLQFKEFRKRRAAKQAKNSDIMEWQSRIFDIQFITRSPEFLIEMTKKLKETIIARYRN